MLMMIQEVTGTMDHRVLEKVGKLWKRIHTPSENHRTNGLMDTQVRK